MNNYLKRLKQRSAIILLYGQLFIIMVQLATLDQKTTFVCRQNPYENAIVCIQE
jgi:hypothetical protein